MNEINLWAAFIYIGLGILGLIIAVAIVIRVIRGIGKVFNRTGTLFGTDTRTRLVSLGIASIFFPKVVASLAYAFYYFAKNFLVDAPQELFSNWQEALQTCAAYNNETMDCVGHLSYGFIKAWTSAISDSLARFSPQYLPYDKLFFMLAFWAIIALAFSTPKGSKGSKKYLWIQTVLGRSKPITKQNAVFFLVLIVGAYLSIAAIAAIPILQEPATASDEVSVERLEQLLDSSYQQMRDRIEAEPGETTPFISLEEFLQDNQEIGDDARQELETKKEMRQSAKNLYTTLLQEVNSQADNAKSSAIAEYRASIVDRKGSQETVRHFLSINAWFRRKLDGLETQVAGCRRSLIELDRAFRLWSSDTQSKLQTENEENIQSDFNLAIQDNTERSRETCRSTSLGSEPVPERPGLGDNLGVFGFVASWLISTESLPLTQIVGMLGFGLLGSSVSSLVRYGNKKRNENEPLVKELPIMVIRGATAAILVFLAVKGGLAIFTSGGSEPNSYALLLTCLIAAVFSEDIWQEAHERLKKYLDEDEVSEEEKNKSKKTEEPGKTVTTENNT